MVDLVETPEQAQLRASLRKLFGGPQACLGRAALADDFGYDLRLWRRLADEMGLLGLSLPEAFGGSGFSRADRAAVLIEMGRCLLPSPYLSTVVLAAETLLATGDEDAMHAVLPRIATGEMVASVAYRADPAARHRPLRAVCEGSDWFLSGSAAFVLDGCLADVLLVDAGTAAGESIFMVDATADSVSREPLPTLDLTRPQARVTLSRAPGQLVGEVGGGSGYLRMAMAHATTALAAEQVGGAERCLEAAVGYAGVREQFGRPIGSFQALKHKCADLLIEVESARSAVRYAAAVASDATSADEIEVAAAVAAAYCSSAYFTVAAENVQIHGGIGFTWEHDAHLYFRRAKASEVMFGRPVDHRAFLARQLGLSAP